MRSPLACRRSGRRREKWTAPGRACRQSIQPLHREWGHEDRRYRRPGHHGYSVAR
jgi:hypothetical protein